MTEQLGRLAEVVTGVEGRDVRLEDLLPAAELALEPVERDVDGAVVHPRHEPEREHVLRALGLLLADTDALDRPHRDRRHRDAVDLVAVEGAVGRGIGLVAGLLQVALGEGVLVEDDRAAAGDGRQIRLQRRGVHRHEDVGVVTRRRDVARGELDLEGGDAVHGAGRGADLGREVRQGREVVTEDRGRVREAVAGQLHAVAGVPGEPDDDVVAFLDGLGHSSGSGSLLRSERCRLTFSVLRRCPFGGQRPVLV